MNSYTSVVINTYAWEEKEENKEKSKLSKHQINSEGLPSTVVLAPCRTQWMFYLTNLILQVYNYTSSSALWRAGGRGASVSACGGLTNPLLSCWVDPRIAWIKHWHRNCRRPVDGGGGTPRPLLLTGAKKSHLGCLISFELPMGFHNFVVINKIHPLN